MTGGPERADPPEATGIILTGGKSSRMGREKLTLRVGGVPLISRVHDALAPHCREILLVGDGPDLPGAQRVPDLREGREGPLAGLEAGLGAASSRRVFVAAGDMPFVPRDLVGFLLDRLRSRDLRAAVPRRAGRVHPLCAAYDRGVLPDVTRLLDAGTRAAWRLLDELGAGVEYVEEELERFGDPDVYLTNVNAPEDLARARWLAGEEG
ncbi:NTP transferase domain-containing protein [Rubrobacter marinus]|uniref:Probable molybdenum cofactor guanylyltransferase n=1 Tax=Rubrobacter marinus TaxID=2653852 RepID=A0A6G8PY59_9ACTN|nr:molybdenum cofactor guanylyltransferase [Rubrobacter marinus]QIN79098.1 NTP transferase domain-containing protein [Rubrobacter marinus]